VLILAENICCYPIAQGEACDTKSPTVQILAANISCYPIAQGEACDTNGAGTFFFSRLICVVGSDSESLLLTFHFKAS